VPTPTPQPTPTPTPVPAPPAERDTSAGEELLLWLAIVEVFNDVFEDEGLSVMADYDLDKPNALVINSAEERSAIAFIEFSGVARIGPTLIESIDSQFEDRGLDARAERIVFSAPYGDVDCTVAELLAASEGGDSSLECVADTMLIEEDPSRAFVPESLSEPSASEPVESANDETTGDGRGAAEITQAGVLFVGDEVSPGLYYSDVPEDTRTCITKTLETLSDTSEQWLYSGGDFAVIEIRAEDFGFDNEADCGTWRPFVPPPLAADPPTSIVRGGINLVGVDVAPGIYEATPEGACLVKTTSDYSGSETTEIWIYDEGERALIEIASSDVALVNEADDCGIWNRISD